MTYQTKLESLLEEILNQFEDDPNEGWLTYSADGDPFRVVDELSDLLDRANDLIYGTDYPDEEEFLSGHSGFPGDEE